MAEGEEIDVGTRIIVVGKHAGVVRFCGPTQFADGIWFGVELDEENGKNNGSVAEVSYFRCPDKRGMFVRRTALELEQATSPAKGPKGKATARKNNSRKKPEGAVTSTSKGWCRRLSYETDLINVDNDQRELLEVVSGVTQQIHELTDVVRRATNSLDECAIEQTIFCMPPAVLDCAAGAPELKAELDYLLNEACEHLEQRLDERLSGMLELELDEALAAPRKELGALGLLDDDAGRGSVISLTE